jgi:Amt family ammonium transporter
MKRIFVTLALIATTAFSVSSLHAQATNAMATNAMATATNAVAAAPVPTNAPSMEQRLESVEAYFQNGDPTATYKDTNGNWTVNFALAGNIINTNLSNSLGANVSFPGAGHNAWLLTSTALVLFMTLPGLALFYGGMVRKKNVLSVFAQCFLITGLVTILYVICGYGMIFGGAGGAAAMKLDWVYGMVGDPHN